MPNARNRDLEIKLQELFEGERLRSKDDLTRLFCNHLGFTYAPTPLPGRSNEFWGEGEVAELVERESFEILAKAGDARFGAFAIIYGTLRDFNLSDQRAVILQLRKTFRDALYVFVRPKTLDRSAEDAQIHIVYARMRAAEADGADASRLILRRFRFGPGERYRTTAERLAKLDLNGAKSLSASAISALCDRAFDKEALTTEFFKKLDHHIKAIERDLREKQQLAAPQAFSDAQLLIERLIFLYFAQNRGWLNQNATYLLDHFAPYRTDGDGFGYYQEFLHDLFHALAEKDFGGRLPGIPFLNGGLFNDDEFKLPSSKLCIRNGTFADLFDNLLEAYNFTVREDTPLSQEVAVDPEMLGKVFESIVLHAESAGEEYQAPDKRKATGSYYTPRMVVHFICRESLRLYFAQRAESLGDGVAQASSLAPKPSNQDACFTISWSERVSRLFKEIDPTDGFSEEELKILKGILSPAEAKRCFECLRAMRTLDPAVGSGAFPVGLLHELVSLQRIFETAMNGYQDPVKGSGTQWMQKAKEHFIQNSLFGVDIQQQAIEICRLRLWLSLLVDYELGVKPFEAERDAFVRAINRISQLPNLEMNFKRGDSLHDYICGHPVRIEPQTTTPYADDLQRIQKLGKDLHDATIGKTKRKLRLKILEARIALAGRILDDQIKLESDRSFNLSADLFKVAGLSDTETRRRIDDELKQLKKARAELERDATNLRKLSQRHFDKDFYRKLRELEGSAMDGPLNFVWRIDFPRVLSLRQSSGTLRGNFDFMNQLPGQMEIETRKSKIENVSGFDLIVGNPPFVTARNPKKRELYRQRWPRVCHMKFQLVCPFFELSFGLLRPDGQLGFIVSNAFAKREFGKPLVEVFFPTIDLQKVVDCSGLMFPGHGTPTCLVFGAQHPPNEKSAVRVAAILPGGGDLRTAPEDSPLWRALEKQHDHPGFENEFVVVSERLHKDTEKWPWTFDGGAVPTIKQIASVGTAPLLDFLGGSVGFDAISAANDIYYLREDVLRRLGIDAEFAKPLLVGELLRNYEPDLTSFTLWPYYGNDAVPRINPSLKRFLVPFRSFLEVRSQFRKTQLEAGLEWFEFREYHRRALRRQLTYADIATHLHVVLSDDHFVFNQHAPVIELPRKTSDDDHHMVAGVLNSNSALFWLKQICFNKGAGSDEHRDRFEFAGGKLEQVPIAPSFASALLGKPNPRAKRLTTLSRASWERGRELPSLALRKLFEKPNEAYHAWHSSLPGYVAPHAELDPPFSSTAELRDRFARAQAIRDRLRSEMIARQEEMDWLVYEAYGLLKDEGPPQRVNFEMKDEVEPLTESERPFRLWAKAGGDFSKAVALIPSRWSPDRHALWEARLAVIRDNEHIRRIEQPVYKRRWDEQWKVSNRWMAGSVAYAQELIDAFAWWLSEKAEWHLENKAKGGPLALADWSAALFRDPRIAAAWEVAADAIFTIEKFKFDALGTEKKENRRVSQRDDSYTVFERFFRDTVLDQSVAHDIPPAIPWSDLAAKKKWTPAQLKKAQAVRGKLNVPRERFCQMSRTHFANFQSAKTA